MLIGIDASRAGSEGRTGTENYSLNIIKHLAVIDRSNSYVLYSKKPLEKELAPENLGTNFSNCVINWPILWTQGGLTLKMITARPDVLFIPSHTVPWIHSANTVVTIHGLEYEYFPESYTYWQRSYLKFSTYLGARWSKKVIVPSKNTKNDLAKFYQVQLDKIKVIPHGSNDLSVFGSKSPEIKFYFQDHDYMLFIGRLERRKNIVRIIDSFNHVRRQLNAQSFKLVLTGKNGIGYEEIKQAIAKSPFKNDIIVKGYVTDEEKYSLMKKASVFIYISLYEGFGMPILEAQALGIPVVVSNCSSIPEVTGEGAILVDPTAKAEISNALLSIFTNTDLRNRLIEKGKENAKRYSWEKCARETLNILTNQ